MQDAPYGFCQCGCGEKTRLAPCSAKSKGWVKGEPLRFCRGHNRRLSPVEYIVDDSGCWVWQRGRVGNGYGSMPVDGGTRRAHRVYYERAKGPIPAGLVLDHLCRNPSCVNPDHLEPVTHIENCHRGRRSPLTHASAFMLRWCYLTTTLSHRELGEIFGVSKAAARYVVVGETWRQP